MKMFADKLFHIISYAYIKIKTIKIFEFYLKHSITFIETLFTLKKEAKI